MLLDELEKYVSLELGATLKEYKYINIGGKVVYIEGQKGILSFSKEQIDIKLKKQTCAVKGTELFIKYYDTDTIIICGDIVSVVVL